MLVEVVLSVTSVLLVVVSEGVEIALEEDDGVALELVSDGDVLAELPVDDVALGREFAGVDSVLAAVVELEEMMNESVGTGTDAGLVVMDADSVELKLGSDEAVGMMLDGEDKGLPLDATPEVGVARDEEDSELGVVELPPVGAMLDSVVELELVPVVVLDVADSELGV